MSIQSEITRISGNVTNALNALETVGIEVPEDANSDDLEALILQTVGKEYVDTEVGKLSEEKVDKTGLTLGVHTDGLIYLFVDGVPVGTGVEPGTSGDVVGYIDSENNIVLTGALAEGTYTVKYEMEDGTLVDIGTLSNVEEEPEPTYTNLADPTSSDWAEGMRFNSSGTLVAVDAGVNGAATNYIGGSFAVGDVVRVKGMDLRTYRTAIYDKNKAQKSVGALLNAPYYFSDISVDATSAIFTIKSTSDNALTGGGYIRFCGPLNGTSKDVIITINEEIV